MESLPFFTFLYSLLIFSFLSLSLASDTLTPKRTIGDGETLISSSQRFELGFFSPGNSKNRYLGIWYKKSPDVVVWVANRNSPLTDLYGVLAIGNGGNLVLLNQTENVIWSSYVSKIIIDPVAQLLDSGNLVLIDSSTSSERYQWESYDYPTDTLLPGMKLGWNFKNGQEKYLTSWRSANDPSSGEYINKLDIHGLPEGVINSGSMKKYRTGPWNGIYFGGVPMTPNSVYTQNIVNNENESYFAYESINKSVVTRLTINESGWLQRSIMYDWGTEWKIVFSLPRDLCDNYGQCGANTICRASRNPVCDCLKGFRATSEGELDIQSWSGSTKCLRKSPLCRGEEGFLKIVWVKLPDFEFRLDKSTTSKECEAECLKNCSCSAYANLNVRGEGNVCLMWFGDLIDTREQYESLRGEDIYIRVSASELQESNKKKRLKRILVFSVPTVSGIFILALIFCISWKRKNKKGKENLKEKMDVPHFDFDVVVTATNNFSPANRIGEGGFGPVYKGKLLSGQEIAVKKLSKNSGQGVEEFRSEVVLIAKLQHRNLIGLLGTCIQGEDRILIYEYMPNKSLDCFIFDHKRSALLGWKERFNIVLGIARGLLYLHQDSKLQIVHRDLKPSNILLDSNLNPKISDFGLARISGDHGKEGKTKRVVGTYGYMSPEYAIDGTFSAKSDVFSLGVLLLEMVTGKRNRGFTHPDHHHNLLGHAWLMWNEGRAVELIEESLEGICDESQVLRLIQVGLLCVQKHPEDRPQMSSIVFMLANEEAVLPQPKQPGFFVERSSGMEATSRKEEYNTENTVSITVLEAR